MELELIRTYFPHGTNGVLHSASRNERDRHDDNKQIICYTIELPWLNNQHKISCIPEGRYELTKRYSRRYGHHLLVNNVANRSYILIHAYNDAMKESKGCIAPVSLLIAEGKGNSSRKALKKLLDIVYPELEKRNKVFITIKSVRK